MKPDAVRRLVPENGGMFRAAGGEIIVEAD
jgi:hypothetical protein